MTKEEILDYITSTPENTNRRVLSDMLDEFNSGGGGGALIVEVDGDLSSGFFLNKTAGEIINALPLVFVKVPAPVGEGEGYERIPGYGKTEDGYSFSVDGENFTAPTLDDYPQGGGVS